MAGATGLTGKPMMRDAVLENDQAYLSPMDKEIAGLTKPGNLDPRYPAHREMILTIADAIKGGLVSEENAAKVAELNPGAKPFFLKALAERQQAASLQKEFSPYFQPGQPAQESIPGQGYGPPELSGPNAGVFPASGKRDAVAPVNDLAGAALHARNRGMYTLADQFDKSARDAHTKDAYGGVNTGQIPGTNNYLQYIIDPKDLKPREVGTGRVLIPGKDYLPTVGMTFQNVLGPGGVNQIVSIPTRGVPGQQQQVTQTGLMPDKNFTPETAGKLRMIDQGIKDVQRARDLVFDENGKLNRGTLFGAGIPGTAGVTEKSRMLYSAIENAVSAKYRAETGAAGNAEEVKSISRRFTPTALDSDQSAEDKLSRLEEYLSSTYDTVDPSKTYPRISAKQPANPSARQSTAPTAAPKNNKATTKEVWVRDKNGNLVKQGVKQ